MTRGEGGLQLIEVLVVEDSRVVRDYLVYILESDPAIRVVGVAESGEAALEFLAGHRPDVVLMDVHLPGIDGIETTRRIMSSDPVPVVVCTASTNFDQVRDAMGALEAGALALLKKPRGIADPDAEVEGAEIVKTLKLMSEVRVVRRWSRTPTLPAPAPAPAVEAAGAAPWPDRVAMVAIGASTGGPPAVAQILSALAPGFGAPILLVQHISPGFSAGFVEWLASVSGLPVHLAGAGDTPLPGHVYVAPDGAHLEVGRGGELRTSLEPPQHGLRPSVGVLFRSVAERLGSRAIGVLLTGMGRDGAEELKLMADRGALTVAQDEESCAVFGMPGEAVRLGAARLVLPPRGIGELLASVLRPRQPGGSP